MEGDTESDSESEYTGGAHSDLAQAVDALCMLSAGLPRVDSCAALAKPVQVSERERRKNLELVRVFEKRVSQGLLRRCEGKRADKRADKRAHQRVHERKGEGGDIGRRVQVLWIPFDFPKYKRAKSQDLRPFTGRVVQHEPGRGVKTHRVLYNDKTLAWHAVDQLKFL